MFLSKDLNLVHVSSTSTIHIISEHSELRVMCSEGEEW
jgi:hypothetical protein